MRDWTEMLIGVSRTNFRLGEGWRFSSDESGARRRLKEEG